ncbi:hypothetical protein BLNAU_3238 [Blattamonas nauphoetae]|uniref:C2H2-type domain-containing protein n=1 Tax=Blattamonas nauphoetae TaxID=2049346 RepID=A0ABQ9YDG6_9EUKA|nr:hypothetical protein BLNAU_3238 [Blattamonas nauphoetae]
MYYRNPKQSEEPEWPFFIILAPPVPAPQEASQPGNQEDDQKAPASPPVQTGKPNSQDWRSKLKKQKQLRRGIIIAKQKQENARSPFECRFCDWFFPTPDKTNRHEKVCKHNPQSEKFKLNEQHRRKHEENERKVAKNAEKPRMKRKLIKDHDSSSPSNFFYLCFSSHLHFVHGYQLFFQIVSVCDGEAPHWV